jgi:type VI secretion system protein ImpM
MWCDMSGGSVGFFGKLPSHGDFLERRVNDAFREAWDDWLQRSIAQSQRVLGAQWLDCYLTSPLWRFFLSEGIAGAASFAGVLMPSVDRVGRYFPLTVVAELPPKIEPLAFARLAHSWFINVENLCTDALQSQAFDLAAFDASLSASSAALADADSHPMRESFRTDATQWRWAIRSADEIEGAMGCALMSAAQNVLRPMAMWWTDGSELVQPSALLTRGLPRPESFAALLAGNWNDGVWHGDLQGARAVQPVLEEAHFAIESTGATDAGPVREENQDNFAVAENNRLWAVADGMGGHRDGDVASQMVVDALRAIEPAGSLNASLEAIRVALARVNADLQRSALEASDPEIGGSTVVVLIIRGSEFAVCWAGDSRAYLFRDGALKQLTRDHVEAPLSAEEEADSLVALVGRTGEITRAVGGRELLELDQVVDAVVEGDRFLLCSDGLYDALDEAAITDCMKLATSKEASNKLIALARDAGARDNVTAVVVDVRPQTQ